MGFFSNVQYGPKIASNGWLNLAEEAANVCRAPRRWLSADLLGAQKHWVVMGCSKDQLEKQEMAPDVSQGIRKVIRVVLSLFLALPGELAGAFFMAIAYINPEIRLKHQAAVRDLTVEERQKLADFIQARQKLAEERQGCDPITCLLCSICCMMCSLVSKKRRP